MGEYEYNFLITPLRLLNTHANVINGVKNAAKQRVASSMVEYSAFNRFVLGSNPRRPIKIDSEKPTNSLSI